MNSGAAIEQTRYPKQKKGQRELLTKGGRKGTLSRLRFHLSRMFEQLVS
jgi:hypothetical protein